MSMDTDAVINNATFDPNWWIEEKHMVISDDSWGGIFNAGVYIVKNSAVGREIMDKWMTFYNESRCFESGNGGKEGVLIDCESK